MFVGEGGGVGVGGKELHTFEQTLRFINTHTMHTRHTCNMLTHTTMHGQKMWKRLMSGWTSEQEFSSSV